MMIIFATANAVTLRAACTTELAFLVMVSFCIIVLGHLLIIRVAPINSFSIKLSKFPPLSEIRQFDGP